MKDFSHIMSYATCEDLQNLQNLISANHKIKLIKNPQKTLTMVKVRETTGNSLFYLGEALCTECMVMVDNLKGFSVMLGDDFEKAIAAAAIDAVLHSEFPEKTVIVNKLLEIKEAHIAAKAVVNGEILKSKVEFNLMGE